MVKRTCHTRKLWVGTVTAIAISLNRPIPFFAFIAMQHIAQTQTVRRQQNTLIIDKETTGRTGSSADSLTVGEETVETFGAFLSQNVES